jgi:hypothetical protein
LFAVDWHPQNLARSWEVPTEKSLATTVMAQQHSALTKASPLNTDLIQQIKRHYTNNSNATNQPLSKVTAAKSTAMDADMEGGTDSDDDIFADLAS